MVPDGSVSIRLTLQAGPFRRRLDQGPGAASLKRAPGLALFALAGALAMPPSRLTPRISCNGAAT